MARPKKYNIDGEQVRKLANYGCSADLIEKSYSDFLTKGRAEMKLRLRQLQWKSAEKGSAAMLIFLGKNILGQADIPVGEDSQPLEWSID